MNGESCSVTIKRTIRLLMIILLFPMINIVTQTYQAYSHIQDLKVAYIDDLASIKEARWKFIIAIMEENRDKASIQSSSVKNRIESRLLQEYKGNYEQLKIDLDSNYDNRAFQIMNEEIHGKYINVDNDNNDIFIATPTRVIVDKSINCSIGKLTRSWEEEASLHSNQVLANESIKLLVNRSNQLIFWKFLPDSIIIPQEEQILYPSIDGLKKLYNVYGIDGLRAYEFLAPSYIRRDTDIFNVPDISNRGLRNENTKLIVVQGFNLVDVLEKDYGKDLAYFTYLEDTASRELHFRENQYVRELVMNLTLLIASFVGIFLTAKLIIKWGGDDAIGGCKG